jgi:hypothetical protein
MSDDDRTTPLGLFNYARSYWQSGVLLHDARAKVTHPEAPVTLLLAHAIELYLKAFLRLRGMALMRSKTALATTLKSWLMKLLHRLSLVGEDRDIAAILTEKESIRRGAYIETGYYQRPGLAALSRTCRSLDQSVSAALKDAGMSVQSTELNHVEAD